MLSQTSQQFKFGYPRLRPQPFRENFTQSRITKRQPTPLHTSIVQIQLLALGGNLYQLNSSYILMMVLALSKKNPQRDNALSLKNLN